MQERWLQFSINKMNLKYVLKCVIGDLVINYFNAVDGKASMALARVILPAIVTTSAMAMKLLNQVLP
jgi:hypothetical protein